VRRRSSAEATDERERFASVAEQTLVHRPPPRAAGRRCVERVEQTALRLPPHEGQGRPPERDVAWCAPDWPVVGAVDQDETRRRIVARARDLLVGPAERVAALAHRRLENPPRA
jgi:hypothetical protein